MRYANWLVATAIGASLSLSSASGWAQLKTGAKKDADVPKGKALGVSDDLDVPKGKGFGLKGDVPQGKALGTEKRAAAEERRETRRIPVIDANANATFRLTQLIGTNISDADGRTIGKVVDFVSDARGNILYPIVSYSGSAGFTGKLFAIPPSGLSFTAGGNNTTTTQFAFDPQLLKNAPSFSSTRFPDFSGQAFVNELKTFYADLLPSTANNRAATTVPNTPKGPVVPTLPANGPGDRPATPGARIPGTTGTENAGFPAASGTTRAGASDSPASSAIPGGTVVGRTGSPASESVRGSVAGDIRTGVEAEGTAANNRLMLRSSQLLGMSIQDNKGQVIGKIIDLVGDESGNRQFAVVSLTGDDRMIVLPMHALHFQGGANGSNFATLRVAPGQLKQAPSFTGDEWPDFTNQEFMTNLQRFYEPLLPGGSTTASGGTRTPPYPSRPIPPGGPVPRPGPDGQFLPATPTTGFTTPTGPTTPGGSRSTPGGTRTPDYPSRPIPPGGPVPPPTTPTGPTTPGGSRSTPGGTRTPDYPSRPIPPGGPVPSSGGSAPSGGGASGGAGAGASGT